MYVLHAVHNVRDLAGDDGPEWLRDRSRGKPVRVLNGLNGLCHTLHSLFPLSRRSPDSVKFAE